MVVSYLMGWGDLKTSHSYSPLYWSSFMAALYKAFPVLRSVPRSVFTRHTAAQPSTHFSAHGRRITSQPDTSTEASIAQGDTAPGVTLPNPAAAEAAEAEDAEVRALLYVRSQYVHLLIAPQNGNEHVTLEVNGNGTLYAKCQLTDYALRGRELEDFSVFAFVMDTYETKVRSADRDAERGPDSDAARRPGRPRHARSRYLDQHPCSKSKLRVMRADGHRSLVNVIGRWFVRNDDPEVYDNYCASMLMLLKPWRNLRSDLKREDQTWQDAFSDFMATASEDDKYVVSGAQYFHECALAAEAERQDEDPAEDARRRDTSQDMFDDGNGDPDTADLLSPTEYTEESLAALKAAQTNLAEKLHALHAIEVAKSAGFFCDAAVSTWDVTRAKVIGAATGDELVKLHNWKAQMAEDVLNQQQSSDGSNGEAQQGAHASVVSGIPQLASNSRASVHHVDVPTAEEALPAVDVQCLREDQFRAYDIIVWHLEQTLAGAQVPPLRMILYGEGGTGKSRVIQTATEAFAARGCAFMLVKAAYTGIAASLIDGKTTHLIGHIAVGKDVTLSDDGKRLLQAFWRGKRYLILDEFSMLAKSFLAALSRHIGIAMEGQGLDSDQSFGGLNVVLCGDLHQFPPVACAKSEALYKPTDLDADLSFPDRVLGRNIYLEFSMVVVLREQMRVSDPVWREFLVSLRYGRVQQEHLAMLRTLILAPARMSPNGEKVIPRWGDSEPSLVTPRHAVRHSWNASGARKWCQDSGQRLYVVGAEDRVKGRALTMRERVAVIGRMKTSGKRKRKDLPEQIELAIGMKVMVTTNIQTDLDLANGARGEIVDIILHADEPACTDPVVHLQHLPAYVLVKMSRTRASKLKDLASGVIPVEPTKCTMQIEVERADGSPMKRTVTRRQFPITPAYAFTDYRSQGQTIPSVLVDISSPPGPAKLSLFNLYVALSRSSGRSTIRLLRDFEDSLFYQEHDEDLLTEDARLDELDRKTKAWWLSMHRGRAAAPPASQNGSVA